jgi:hypothetical protein
MVLTQALRGGRIKSKDAAEGTLIEKWFKKKRAMCIELCPRTDQHTACIKKGHSRKPRTLGFPIAAWRSII